MQSLWARHHVHCSWMRKKYDSVPISILDKVLHSGKLIYCGLRPITRHQGSERNQIVSFERSRHMIGLWAIPVRIYLARDHSRQRCRDPVKLWHWWWMSFANWGWRKGSSISTEFPFSERMRIEICGVRRNGTARYYENMLTRKRNDFRIIEFTSRIE